MRNAAKKGENPQRIEAKWALFRFQKRNNEKNQDAKRVHPGCEGSLKRLFSEM
jgi:hypothetical protein